jgi:hypothetical protein
MKRDPNHSADEDECQKMQHRLILLRSRPGTCAAVGALPSLLSQGGRAAGRPARPVGYIRMSCTSIRKVTVSVSAKGAVGVGSPACWKSASVAVWVSEQEVVGWFGFALPPPLAIGPLSKSSAWAVVSYSLNSNWTAMEWPPPRICAVRRALRYRRPRRRMDRPPRHPGHAAPARAPRSTRPGRRPVTVSHTVRGFAQASVRPRPAASREPSVDVR